MALSPIRVEGEEIWTVTPGPEQEFSLDQIDSSCSQISICFPSHVVGYLIEWQK